MTTVQATQNMFNTQRGKKPYENGFAKTRNMSCMPPAGAIYEEVKKKKQKSCIIISF